MIQSEYELDPNLEVVQVLRPRIFHFNNLFFLCFSNHCYGVRRPFTSYVCANFVTCACRCFTVIYYMQINSQKKKTGVIAPKRFVQWVKKENENFRSYMYQVSCFSIIFYVEFVTAFCIVTNL